MKRKIMTLILLLVVSICLTGCEFNLSFNKKEESPEVKLCNQLQELAVKYDDKTISFGELVSEAEVESNEYCTEHADEDLCTTIKDMRHHEDTTYEIKDCSNLPTSPANFKALCETGNKATEELIRKKDDVSEAYVHNLDRQCRIIKGE